MVAFYHLVGFFSSFLFLLHLLNSLYLDLLGFSCFCFSDSLPYATIEGGLSCQPGSTHHIYS